MYGKVGTGGAGERTLQLPTFHMLVSSEFYQQNVTFTVCGQQFNTYPELRVKMHGSNPSSTVCASYLTLLSISDPVSVRITLTSQVVVGVEVRNVKASVRSGHKKCTYPLLRSILVVGFQNNKV